MSNSLQPVDQMVPGANLGAYVQAVSSIPVLSIERERELGEDLYYNDNLQAARELVMSHLRFVVHIARSYSGYGLAEADLIQEGNVGLMKAVKRYNPEKGVRLVSFAVHWIKRLGQRLASLSERFGETTAGAVAGVTSRSPPQLVTFF